MSQKPIKRSQNLVPLSKDHHEGLLVVWKIRQGVRNAVAGKRIADFVLHAFTTHLAPHFREEEELLFSKVDSADELCVKALEQHAAIKQMVSELPVESEGLINKLEAFANLLEEHIRFEERTLFFHLENQLPSKTMDAIGDALVLIHSNKQPLFWYDQFWVKN
ncbi:hemerythrin domain-containing protein [Segetibacter aerophilus]|uniref:Hemerythrin-like domain-containing protein n=1 Tax=Segetibacter aerophilus TaxID=670293 RepID=A0A512BJN2_9BACT|nr:hemerythrin domain-containing protein [Segetibacter aerophilus]GEO12166.1 hypothetical protein SAE01_46620 [Segetibacter aerophilus]